MSHNLDTKIEKEIDVLLGEMDALADTVAQEVELPVYSSKRPHYGKEILVMSGGGIRGLIHIGALQKLCEERVIEDISIFAGTSAGALILSLYLLGYTPSELLEFSKVFNFKSAINVDLTLFSSAFGVDNGTRFEFMLKKFIKKKTDDENFTLQQLYEKTHKTFVITTTCVNSQTLVYMDHKSHPDLPIWQAIRMTTCVPYFFVPFRYQDKWYVDGACMDNYPAHRYKDRIDKIIGVYIVEGKQHVESITNLEEYSYQLLQCLRHGLNHKCTNGFEECTVMVPNDLGFLDVDLTPESKISMYQDGYNKVAEYLDKIKKKNHLD